MTEQPPATSTTAFERWEDESSDLEYRMVDAFKQHQADSWGNSYVATGLTALEFGVPQYVVNAAIQHYDEIVHADVV